MNPDSWTLAANIAQVFASVSVIVAILFAIIQLREATRARYLEALTKIFEDFRSEEFFQDRRFVYSHDEFVYESCNDEEKRRVERLINAFNRMSFLAEKGLLPRKLILEMWSGALYRSWQKLELYVAAHRKEYKFSDWAIQFEHMAALSREYRIKVLGEDWISHKISLQQPDTGSPSANELQQ
jgi:hypothetical protein